MTSWGPTDTSITGLLDHGSRTLLYFEEFGPRYTRAFGDDSPVIRSYEELHKRYYEQNGMNEAALADAFEAVSAAARMMVDEHDAQQTIAQNISQAWQGDAASAAQEMIGSQLDLASTDAAAAKAIASALQDAPTALRAAVTIKSTMVLQILENGEDVKIDGKTPEDVDAIIAGAAGIGLSNLWSDDTAASRIRRIFPDMEEGFFDGLKSAGEWIGFRGVVFAGSPYADMLEDRCRHWLDNVFKPDYPAKIAKFIQACDLTHQGVLAVYKTVTDAMDGLGEYPYPQPEGTSSPITPSGDIPTPAGDTPTSTLTSTGTPSTGTPSTDTPTTPASTPTGSPANVDIDDDDDSTDPAGASNPLSGSTDLSQIAGQLSPLLTSLSEGVQSALTALTTTVDEEIDKALENLRTLTNSADDADGTGMDNDGDDTPDEEPEPLAGFALAGKEVTFEQGDDGLKMVVTAPDGTSTEYRMTIDENGVPLVSAVEDGSARPAGEGEEQAAEGASASDEQPAGPGAVPLAPAPAEREEDGEYTPQPIPAPEFTEDETEPETPAPPQPRSDELSAGETGALLAEAGPL